MPTKGRYVVKRVPNTTGNITKGIINFLNAEGHRAVRINVQGQYDERLQMWRKSGSTVGVLDIACTLRPGGRHLVVDVKKGKDTLSPEQVDYMEEVTRCGGLACSAGSVDEFVLYYTLAIKPAL